MKNFALGFIYILSTSTIFHLKQHKANGLLLIILIYPNADFFLIKRAKVTKTLNN